MSTKVAETFEWTIGGPVLSLNGVRLGLCKYIDLPYAPYQSYSRSNVDAFKSLGEPPLSVFAVFDWLDGARLPGLT